MKKSVLTLAVSILLTAALIFGAPAALAAGGEEPDPSVSEPLGESIRTSSLTVKLDNAEYAEDLDPVVDPAAPGETDPGAETDKLAAPLAVDLYQVAPAEKISGSDGYTYSFSGLFAGLEESFGKLFEDAAAESRDVPAAVWQEMALTAARTVFSLSAPGGEAAAPALAPAATADGLKEIDDLPAGLYLIVPHGKGLEPKDYVAYDGESLTARAFTRQYQYSFTPYLVSLPGRNVAGPDTTGGSAGDGAGWNYAVTTYLKVERELRYGQLEILKGVDAYRDGSNASFVFEVKAYDGTGEGAKLVYSNVVGLDFRDGETNKSVTLDFIPACSFVTVTEVYSGASYTAAADTLKDLPVSAMQVTQASFTNRPNDRNSGGYGANNHYVYSEAAGGWSYETPAEG